MNTLEQMYLEIERLKKKIDGLETLETGGAWVDYSATSTITGWSSFTTKALRYMYSGKLVFVSAHLAGTSDSTSTSFTLPAAATAAIAYNVPARAQDNGGAFAWGLATLAASASTVNCYSTAAGGAWTASGTKTAFVQFFYVRA